MVHNESAEYFGLNQIKQFVLDLNIEMGRFTFRPSSFQRVMTIFTCLASQVSSPIAQARVTRSR